MDLKDAAVIVLFLHDFKTWDNINHIRFIAKLSIVNDRRWTFPIVLFSGNYCLHTWIDFDWFYPPCSSLNLWSIGTRNLFLFLFRGIDTKSCVLQNEACLATLVSWSKRRTFQWFELNKSFYFKKWLLRSAISQRMSRSRTSSLRWFWFHLQTLIHKSFPRTISCSFTILNIL